VVEEDMLYRVCILGEPVDYISILLQDDVEVMDKVSSLGIVRNMPEESTIEEMVIQMMFICVSEQ
jgi:hypothetical protein